MRRCPFLIPNPACEVGHPHFLQFLALVSEDKHRYYDQNYEDGEQNYDAKLFEVSFKMHWSNITLKVSSRFPYAPRIYQVPPTLGHGVPVRPLCEPSPHNQHVNHQYERQ